MQRFATAYLLIILCMCSCQQDREGTTFDQRELYVGTYPVKVQVIYEKFSDTNAGELQVRKGAHDRELQITLVTDSTQEFPANLTEDGAFLVPDYLVVGQNSRIQFSGQGTFLPNSVNMTLDAVFLEYNTRQRIAVTGR